MADNLPFAAIDIGSNSFRLEIASLHRGRYRRQLYLKRGVRLGAGLDAQGHLTEDAAQRGLACLTEFAAHLQGFDPSRVRAVATQTLREARNRDAFLARAQAALGHPIEVISGREEARLIYAGVSRLQPSEAPRLVIDIGGRSTELILGQGQQPLEVESFPVGSVGLSLRYFAEGRLHAEAFRAAQVAAGAEFEEALGTFAPTRWQEALGSSGTVGAIADILTASGLSDGRITPALLTRLMDDCLRAGHVDALAWAGLKEDRRAVIPGGLAILYTLMVHFGIGTLHPAKGALRQGVVFDLHARRSSPTTPTGKARTQGDPRDATVQALQQRFGVDRAQAARVRGLALALYQQVQPAAPADARRELAWAAELHELGMALSHHDHHRHSAYMLGHADAAGFSQSQQRHLATLVLGQRGGLRKVATLLHEPTNAWPLLCLRLAVIACHARAATPTPRWSLHRPAQGAMDVALLDWKPKQRPHVRTLHLLREEAQAWGRGTPLRLQLPAD